MLTTPEQFLSLITAPEHPNPTTLVFRGDELLLRERDLSVPDHTACAAVGLNAEHLYPVGLLGEIYYRTTFVARDTAAPDGHVFSKLRPLFFSHEEQFVAIAGRAYQIAEWARTHRHCGVCGSLTHLLEGERCMRCPQCGHSAYPRISPAMMVLIRKGDSILLARNVAAPAGRFSALAGFLEAGESVEDAVHREVFEEVGLKVHKLRYFGSQAWPFPHSLMIAYVAQYLSGDIRVDANEIAEAHWYGPNDKLPDYASTVSIAGALITTELAAIRANRPA